MKDGIDDYLENLNKPLDLIEQEFEMLRKLYYGLQPLSPAARARVVGHVMGMLKSRDTVVPRPHQPTPTTKGD